MVTFKIKRGDYQALRGSGTHWSHLQQRGGPGGVYRSYGCTYNKEGATRRCGVKQQVCGRISTNRGSQARRCGEGIRGPLIGVGKSYVES